MHIVYVAIDYHQAGQGGGIASYTAALGGELIKRGHQITIIAKGNHQEWCDLDGLQLLIWPFGNISWYIYRLGLLNDWLMLPIREWEWSWSIRQAIEAVQKRSPIDLIECGESGNQFVSGIPHVIRTHGAPYMFSRFTGEPLTPGLRLSHRLELRALRRANVVTAPSQAQATELETELKWPKERIKAIPNPVAQWAVNTSRVERPDSPIVLYAGRLQSVKGTLILIDAVVAVARAVPDVRFVLAGGRHISISDAALEQALDQDERRAHITLLGHIPWQQLAEWYQKASVFVMPSYYETFCIACVEAMAFGLPVVATRAGGLPEVVDDGETGLLVPPGESSALAEAITRLLRDSALRRRMGEAGRTKALSLFTAERVADRMLEVYEACRA